MFDGGELQFQPGAEEVSYESAAAYAAPSVSSKGSNKRPEFNINGSLRNYVLGPTGFVQI